MNKLKLLIGAAICVLILDAWYLLLTVAAVLAITWLK